MQQQHNHRTLDMSCRSLYVGTSHIPLSQQVLAAITYACVWECAWVGVRAWVRFWLLDTQTVKSLSLQHNTELRAALSDLLAQELDREQQDAQVSRCSAIGVRPLCVRTYTNTHKCHCRLCVIVSEPLVLTSCHTPSTVCWARLVKQTN